MAKVFTYQGRSQYAAVLEDPRPGNDGFYIYGDRHDKTSLTPQFNSTLNLATGSGFSGGSQFAGASTSSGSVREQHMFLNKPTVYVSTYVDSSTGAHYGNTPDDTSWRFMDETMHSNVGLVEFSNQDGTNKTLGNMMPHRNDGRYRYGNQWTSTIPDSTYLHEVKPSYYTSSVQFYGIDHMYIKDSGYSGHILGMYKNLGSSYYFYPSYYITVSGTGFPSSWGSTYNHSITNMSSYWGCQWLGKSQNDGGYFVAGNYGNSGNYADAVRITKVLLDGDSTPTQTSVHDTYDAAAPLAAAGTHQGGNNLNGKAFWHANSKIFDDPRAAGKKCFYKPYFDSYGDFHPLLTTWTLADDTFVTETDISITGDKSTTHASMLNWAAETTIKNTCIVAEQWYSGSARYVSYFPIDSRNAFSSDTGFKTLVIYQVDSANPKNLTYHSKLELADSFRNYIWLNDDRTLLGLFFRNSFKMYVWNDISGWTETTTIGERVYCMGRDSLDRIWYTTNTTGSTSNYADVNLLSPTLPVSVNITPELSSYAYGGSDIATYIDVSTLNSSGARIAVNVRLVIEGGAMTFDDGSTVKTVTTLTTGDLQVATKVVGAGYTNVTASIQL